MNLFHVRLFVLGMVLGACPVRPMGGGSLDAIANPASDPPTPAGACQHLITLRCATMDASACEKGISDMLAVGAPLDLSCITSAPSKEAERACAGVGPAGCP